MDKRDSVRLVFGCQSAVQGIVRGGNNSKKATMNRPNSVNKKLHLVLEIQDSHWRHVPGLKARLKKAAALLLASLPEKYQNVACCTEATVLLTTDKKVQQLNYDFRGKNKPTNVLSFPAMTRAELNKSLKMRDPLYLGDIAMAYQVTAKEAKAESKLLKNHATHLLIHGLLHLFGYDHLTDRTATQMERMERQLMADLGLPDPYELSEKPLAPPPQQTRSRKRAIKA